MPSVLPSHLSTRSKAVVAQGQTALWGQQEGRRLFPGGVRTTGDGAESRELLAAPRVAKVFGLRGVGWGFGSKAHQVS